MDDGTAVLVEVNARPTSWRFNESFRSFVGTIKSTVAADGADDVASKVDTERTELVATIGENIQVRAPSASTPSSSNFAYVHPGNRIAVILKIDGGDGSDALKTFGKDLCFYDRKL